MNKVLLAICGTALLWTGCKENNTPLDFGHKSLSDTTYVLPTGAFPTTADPHNVLVEEFTGARCSNCPAAHELLKADSVANPGRINVIGLHIWGPPQGGPVPGNTHDFRDSVANQVSVLIYGGNNALPGGGIDRTAVSSAIYLPKDLWSSTINTQLSAIDPLNLSVETHNNPLAGVDTIIVKVTYVSNTTANHNLSVVIVEDNMYDKQENGLTTEDNYLFMNVFREMVTPSSGTPLGDAKEAGRVYQKVFVYKPKTLLSPNPQIDPTHCRVIAFVSSNGTPDYHVVQSVQTPLRH